MLTLITPPSGDVVTVAEMRDYLRIFDDFQDSVISDAIAAAVEYCENIAGRKLLLQSWREQMPRHTGTLVLRPTLAPVAVIQSVKYRRSGELVTASSGDYQLAYRAPGLIEWVGSEPSVDDVWDAWTIEYQVGSATVPASLKTAVKVVSSWMFENRSGGKFPDEAARQIVMSAMVVHGT
jgi:uncharacterized phiE125 gp8 family phage protein